MATVTTRSTGLLSKVVTRFAAAVLLVASAVPASAGERVSVDAVYMISIAGWNIARANVDIAIDNGRYDASLFMKPSGVAKIVTAVRTSVSAN